MTTAPTNPPEIPEGSPARCGATLRDYAGNAMFCGRPPHDRTVKHRSGEPPDVTEWVDPAGTGDVDRAQVAAPGGGDLDADGARPGEWFVDGTEDFYGHNEGTPRPECPHAEGTDATTWWHRGYGYAQRLWRAQCAERERDVARHALDDARATIAAALAALEAEPGADLVERCRAAHATHAKLYDALDLTRKQRDEAVAAADERHARAVRLADEVAALRARVAEIEAERAQLADDAAEWRAYRAAATARTDPATVVDLGAGPAAPSNGAPTHRHTAGCGHSWSDVAYSELPLKCPKCGEALDPEELVSRPLAIQPAPEWTEATPNIAFRTQPAPSGGVGDCWAELLEALDAHGLGHLRARCEARRALGIARYGGPLGRDDGRDSTRDLEEELLDAAVYAQRLLGRPRAVSPLAIDLLRISVDPADRADELALDERIDLALDEQAANERAPWTPRELDVWRYVQETMEAADLHHLCGVVDALLGVQS